MQGDLRGYGEHVGGPKRHRVEPDSISVTQKAITVAVAQGDRTKAGVNQWSRGLSCHFGLLFCWGQALAPGDVPSRGDVCGEIILIQGH